ncbi:V-set and immunoglobulin domain-containing protein 10 isoform X2 [Phaenicophaeus curvirostris]|uniref:V-set and immunoglobulin domain-containing protein 10 isoform X2 n=1 Tax=Phaenicophaeus curvirostris TaxID=33595 RepID=UPI0037F0EDBC
MRLPGGTQPASFLLALCIWRLVPRRDAAGTEEVVFGKVGGTILLLCRNVSKEATEVVWFQGDPHSFPPLFSSRVTFPPDARFSLVDNSSLRITGLRAQDEGNYTCKEVLNKTDHEHRVRLLVARTEEVVFGKVGGTILLLCRNVSKEATEVVWFQGDPHSFPPLFSSRVTFPPDARFSLVDNSSLRITGLRAQDEGNYTCKEVLNKTDHEHRVRLLVANPPRSSPRCWAESSSSGLMLQLFCSWPGGYPHPTLHWREEGHDMENSSWVISSTSSSDTHVETLNSSHLSHRKVFKCVGSHVVEEEEPSCTVEIKLPSLESEPPKTCLVGDNVTLTCRVTEGTPAAQLTWLRGITQPEVEIQPGGRYLIVQEGNVSRLTIRNCSQGTDGGCYVCKAQNPVGLRELFVCLTVKEPVNIVGVVGAVVVLSLLVILTVTGVVLYYNPLLCLRGQNPESPGGRWVGNTRPFTS